VVWLNKKLGMYANFLGIAKIGNITFLPIKA